jgi:hypothetical protein
MPPLLVGNDATAPLGRQSKNTRRPQTSPTPMWGGGTGYIEAIALSEKI